MRTTAARIRVKLLLALCMRQHACMRTAAACHEAVRCLQLRPRQQLCSITAAALTWHRCSKALLTCNSLIRQVIRYACGVPRLKHRSFIAMRLQPLVYASCMQEEAYHICTVSIFEINLYLRCSFEQLSCSGFGKWFAVGTSPGKPCCKMPIWTQLNQESCIQAVL